MKVSQEKLANSQVGLDIEIPAEETKQAYDRVLNDLARSANVPGFRKGKVPRQVVMQRFGRQRLKGAALEAIFEKHLDRAIKEAEIDALGEPALRGATSVEELALQLEPGQPFTFSIAIDVSPEVDVADDYKSLQVRAEEVVFTPEQVDEFLESTREQLADVVPVEDRPAQVGDTAVVDFAGRFPDAEPDSPPIEGTDAQDFECKLEAGQFVEGLVEGIVGMQPEETKTIAVAFPDEYPREDLQGREVVFTVTLKELKARELPALDDDFAREATDDKFETLDAWREHLTASFTERATEQTEANIKQALVDALTERTTAELPKTLVENEIKRILEQSVGQMQQMGLDVEQMLTQEMVSAMHDRALPDAENNLRQTLAIETVAEREQIEADDDAIAAKIQEIAADLDDNSIDFDDDSVRSAVGELVKRDRVVAMLRDRAQIELVPEGTFAAEAEAETETETIAAASEESSEAAAEEAAASPAVSEDAPTAAASEDAET